MAIRHGMRGIADVAVRSCGGIRLRGVERKFSVLAEIEVSGLRFARRPGIKLNPIVAPCLEEHRFLERQRAFVFEPVFEPGNFNFLPKIDGRVAAKGNLAERLARAAAPAAVIPGASNEIVEMFRI